MLLKFLHSNERKLGQRSNQTRGNCGVKDLKSIIFIFFSQKKIKFNLQTIYNWYVLPNLQNISATQTHLHRQLASTDFIFITFLSHICMHLMICKLCYSCRYFTSTINGKWKFETLFSYKRKEIRNLVSFNFLISLFGYVVYSFSCLLMLFTILIKKIIVILDHLGFQIEIQTKSQSYYNFKRNIVWILLFCIHR